MKAGAYTQIYIHVVIAVMYRDRMLNKEIRSEVAKIMGGILKEYGHKPININGVEDHLHIFYGHNPNVSLSDTVKELKRRTTVFINDQHYFSRRFRWQAGYGAFSYSKSQITRVYNYIERQEEHHKKRSLMQEYKKLLKLYGVEYAEKYLFKF